MMTRMCKANVNEVDRLLTPCGVLRILSHACAGGAGIVNVFNNIWINEKSVVRLTTVSRLSQCDTNNRQEES